MDTLKLRPAQADEPGVSALIAAHFKLMRGLSPEESCHVMPADALAADGALFVAVEENEQVIAIGALKKQSDALGELKSMHTASDHRGRGLARMVLNGLLEAARSEGLQRVSLETGTADDFAPARALYQSAGFETCPPFGDYVSDPYSTFMTRRL